MDLRLETALSISGSVRGPKGEPVTNGVMYLRIGPARDPFMQQQVHTDGRKG